MLDPFHQPASASVAWTRGNMGEALPGVCTPLSWSVFGPPTDLGIRRGFQRIGALRADEASAPEEIGERFTTIVHGWAAGNIDLMARMAERMPGVDAEQMERQLFGEVRNVERHPTRARYPAIAARMPVEVATSLARVRAARGAVEAWWRASVRALDGAFASVDLARSVMRAAEHHFVENMALHTTISMVGSGVYDAVAALAAEAGPGHSAAALVTGYGTVEETLVAADLWALSRGTLGIDVFLDRHGYHAPDAGQLHTRVWREQPAVVLALAQSYRAMPEDRSPAELSRRQGAAREGAERALLRALPRLRRGRARLLLALAARYVPHREVGKAGYLMAVDGARAGARAIGREWARVGVLDEPDDVVFLTRDELLGEAPPDRAAELVATRRARFQELRRLVIPEAFVGDPPATPAGALAPLRVGDSIAGIGVSPGVVDGRARVVLDPTAAELEPGEILVCTTTDPSWVSLFMPAAGVVIDVGGQMSHGAIVARELGIPCVINTRDATRRLSTGDRLVIDGGSGVVLVH